MGVLTLPFQRRSKYHKASTCNPTSDTLRLHQNTPVDPTRKHSEPTSLPGEGPAPDPSPAGSQLTPPQTPQPKQGEFA